MFRKKNSLGRDGHCDLYRNTMPDLAILLVLAGMLSLDIIGHIVRSGHTVFGSQTGIQYHWSLDRSISDNLNHASFRYNEDIKHLRAILDPNAMFLSDRATNYYLAATLPLYGTNAHPHHQIYNDDGYSPFFSTQFVGSLCTQSGRSEMKEVIERKAEMLKRYHWYPLKYLVFNVDYVNKNVRGNCLAKNRQTIVGLLSKQIELVYEGEYLVVYEFRNPESLV